MRCGIFENLRHRCKSISFNPEINIFREHKYTFQSGRSILVCAELRKEIRFAFRSRREGRRVQNGGRVIVQEWLCGINQFSKKSQSPSSAFLEIRIVR